MGSTLIWVGCFLAVVVLDFVLFGWGVIVYRRVRKVQRQRAAAYPHHATETAKTTTAPPAPTPPTRTPPKSFPQIPATPPSIKNNTTHAIEMSQILESTPLRAPQDISEGEEEDTYNNTTHQNEVFSLHAALQQFHDSEAPGELSKKTLPIPRPASPSSPDLQTDITVGSSENSPIKSIRGNPLAALGPQHAPLQGVTVKGPPPLSPETPRRKDRLGRRVCVVSPRACDMVSPSPGARSSETPPSLRQPIHNISPDSNSETPERMRLDMTIGEIETPPSASPAEGGGGEEEEWWHTPREVENVGVRLFDEEKRRKAQEQEQEGVAAAPPMRPHMSRLKPVREVGGQTWQQALQLPQGSLPPQVGGGGGGGSGGGGGRGASAVTQQHPPSTHPPSRSFSSLTATMSSFAAHASPMPHSSMTNPHPTVLPPRPSVIRTSPSPARGSSGMIDAEICSKKKNQINPQLGVHSVLFR